MRWRVVLTTRAERELVSYPPDLHRRIIRRLETLEGDPRPPGSRKLGGKADLWRIRVGDYRIVYRVEDAVLVVLVVRIGHRRDVYR